MNASAAKSSDRLRVIACGAIAREVLAIKEANGLDHLELECLPAIWHVYPEKIAPAMRQKIAEARAEGIERIFIGYAECGTQGELDKVCQDEGVERIAGPPARLATQGVRSTQSLSAFALASARAIRPVSSTTIVPLHLGDKLAFRRSAAFRGGRTAVER